MTVHMDTTHPIPTVILLTDDAANRALAEKDSIVAMSVRQYVEGMPTPAPLLDLLSASTDDIEPTRAATRHTLYPEVSAPLSFTLSLHPRIVSTHCHPYRWRKVGSPPSRPFQCKRLQLLGGAPLISYYTSTPLTPA